ncbi:hypothetical protein Pres01_04280 [Metapseudomonas resinovorans]|uniref:DUF1329 domain-containing protein n=1 Tax=Metapseudomonas resinovorans TaxID=53412 RepID=UPI001F325428|nr:DUF1329 domain-containing protein [Pseudomonas resinovorans]GLZ84377.1 hypothetical protein Pres01_04280 [Pseudomonas resinovorans]
MKKLESMTLATLALLVAMQVFATPSDQEISQLGTTLTPLGAEMAGNRDGSIPPWDGGLCKPPAGYQPKKGESGGGPWMDPFANEQPILKITRDNLEQYADKLDAGTKELFQRYPETFRIDVYPSHRTACYPQWVYENTIKNVRNPKLVGGAPGLVNAHAQIPFPIPKNGYEAMWNQSVRVDAPYVKGDQENWLVDAAGNVTLTSINRVEQSKPYWDNDREAVPDEQPYWTLISTTVAPASSAGVKQLRHNFLDTEIRDPMAWSYVPGQRRVRLSPEFKYDTVSTSSGGVLLFDEISGFDGKMDKFDFVLKGKREMYIPANAYKFNAAPSEVVNTPNHVNPDYLRFELRRVWVVEANLKPGERHVQKTKTFYLDEDSWSVAVYNAFDNIGTIQKVTYYPGFQEYDKPQYRTAPNVLYDLTKRVYTHGARMGADKSTGFYRVARYPTTFFSPGSLAGTGIR